MLTYSPYGSAPEGSVAGLDRPWGVRDSTDGRRGALQADVPPAVSLHPTGYTGDSTRPRRRSSHYRRAGRLVHEYSVLRGRFMSSGVRACISECGTREPVEGQNVFLGSTVVVCLGVAPNWVRAPGNFWKRALRVFGIHSRAEEVVQAEVRPI